MTIPNRNINFPTAIKFGSGRIKELADHCKAVGIKRPLFVTDPGLASLPMVQAIVADVKSAGLAIQIFSEVRPNPIEANILAGVKAYKARAKFNGGREIDIAIWDGHLGFLTS